MVKISIVPVLCLFAFQCEGADIKPSDPPDGWREGRIKRGLVPEPSKEELSKAEKAWKSDPSRDAYWGENPEAIEPTAPYKISKTVFYLSPSGDDVSGDGSIAKPWRSFLKAQTAVRNLRRKGAFTGVTVFLRGGVYEVTKTSSFYRLDGGTEEAGVLYAAYPGEKPILDGGWRIGKWETYKGAVKVADVKALGYKHLDSFGPRGFEVSRENTGTPVSDLYIGGERQNISEWPKTSWLRFTCAGTNNTVGIELDSWKRWQNERSLFAKMYPACYWADLTSPVLKLDEKEQKMTIYGRRDGRVQRLRKTLPYRFFNAVSAIEGPGEWCFDFTEGKVYAWEPKGDAVLSSFSKPFLLILDAENIEFRGITFRYGRSDAVDIGRSVNVTFRDCDFFGFGLNGIYARAMSGMTVDRCTFRDFGYHAMRLGGGDRKSLKSARIVVQNCDISRSGNWKRDFAFGLCLDGCGSLVRWNRIRDIPASAIRLNGNDHLFVSNIVERCVYEAGDSGALDVYADPTHSSRIMYNLWRDIGSGEKGFVEAGQAAIRLDDAVSNQIIYGNRFENCSPEKNVVWGFGAIQINGGRNNTIENNLFNGGWRVCSMTGWPQAKWDKYMAGRNVRAMFDEIAWPNSLYIKRYPGIGDLEKMPMINRLYRNIVIGSNRFVPLLNGNTRLKWNFAWRRLPSDTILKENPLWEMLPHESALGPREK